MAITFFNFTHEMYECASYVTLYIHVLSYINPSHLCLGLPNGPFVSGFLIKTLHEFLIPLTECLLYPL